MAKKRKLTKEEKIEIKARAGLGRLCKPECALIVFGREISGEVRKEIYDSGIRIMFTNDIEEVTEMLETAAVLDIPTTMFIRTIFSESPHYFSANLEPLLLYIGKNIDMRIYGHTPYDHVLDRLNLRVDDMDDRAFGDLLQRWSPYCKDEFGYGNRMGILARNEKQAFEKREIARINQQECMTVPFDPLELAEQLATFAEDFTAINEAHATK